MSTAEFNQLLLCSSDCLNPFAIILTRDHDSAKDLVQETMYKAIVNCGKYNDRINIKAWLCKIMQNIFLNDYRKRSRQHAIIDPSTNDLLADLSQTAIADLAESRLKLKEIQTAIHYLPSIFKDPFLLYLEGYKYHEIAEILRKPIGTIKSRIHFARKLLKKQISKY